MDHGSTDLLTGPAARLPEQAPRYPRGPLLFAAGATVLLLAADFGLRAYHEYVEPIPALRRLFNIGSESNLATWWNSALLLAVAATALLAALLTGPSARPGRASWLALAAVATWLSIDETVQVHERLAGIGEGWADGLGTSLPTFAWVLPGAVMALAGVLAAVLWARGLPRDQRLGLLGALAVYITGALVVEAINGWVNRQGLKEVYALGTTLEEGMEMGACLLALAVLARFVIFTRDPASGRLAVRLR
ncbi:hypothetical protein [Actinomadura algeriensis]|uniref:DUF998 domain-containing protein n=1 Tax=Actinomadura algeriensis TaxID=1679523 RepID=A0ABR9JMR4_9ACTN|nr:hypothetical protein [Actinomadura algeriensis]MBE1531848.1 hypothetical protein [Actinomadura algeriensis]